MNVNPGLKYECLLHIPCHLPPASLPALPWLAYPKVQPTFCQEDLCGHSTWHTWCRLAPLKKWSRSSSFNVSKSIVWTVLACYVLFEPFHKTCRDVQVRNNTEFIRALELRNPPNTCGITIVVGNHDWRIKGLKIQYEEWTWVESRSWFHY